MRISFKYYLLISILFLSSCVSINKTRKTNSFVKHTAFDYYYAGTVSRIVGDYPSALDYLQNSLKLSDSNDVVYYELGLIYYKLDSLEFAEQLLSKAIELNPNNSTYKDLLLDIYVASDKFKEAIALHNTLLEDGFSDFYLQFKHALLLAEDKQFDKALSLVDSLEAEVGMHEHISSLKFNIFVNTQDIERSKEELEKLLLISPTDIAYNSFKAELLFMEGFDEEGLHLLDSLSKANPLITSLKYDLFKAHFSFGEKQSAFNILKDIFSDTLVSDIEKYQILRPLFYESQLNSTPTNSILQGIINEGIKVNPRSIPLYTLLYEFYFSRANFESAKIALNQVVLLKGKSASSDDYLQLAQIEYALNEYNEALSTIDLGIVQFPLFSNFYIFKALIEREQNDLGNAILSTQKGINAISNSEEISELYGLLGDLFSEKGNRKEMYKAYEQSLSFNALNASVLNNYAYYLSLENRKLKKALTMSSKAVELSPNNSSYLDTKGWVLFVLKRYDESRDILRNAVAKDEGNSAVILEHYGDVLYMTGEIDRAYIYWLKAKENGGNSEKLNIKISTKKYVP